MLASTVVVVVVVDVAVVAVATVGISDDNGDEAGTIGPPEHSVVVTGVDVALLLLPLLDFGENVCRIDAAQLDSRLLGPLLLEE